MGGWSEKRDLIYIDDLVDFVSPALDKQTTGFEIFNVGGMSFLSVNEIVNLVVQAAAKSVEVVHDLGKPTIKVMFNWIAQSERALGWKPKTPLEEGIVKTIGWWEKNVGPRSDSRS